MGRSLKKRQQSANEKEQSNLLNNNRLDNAQSSETCRMEIEDSVPNSPRFEHNGHAKKKKATTIELTNYQMKNYLRSTTFHGLDLAYESSSTATRVFWATMMVIVFGIAFIQLSKLVQYFIDNPTLTSIAVMYPKNGVEFPGITLCMLSKLNQTRVEERYKNVRKPLAELSMSSFLSAYSTSLMDVYYFNYTLNSSDVELQKELMSIIEPKTVKEFIYDTSFTCENQFLVCWFENGHMFDCCDENQYFTVRRFLTHSGACYEFNNNNKTQRLPGPVGGMGFVYWYPNDHIYKTAYNSYNEFAVHMYMDPVDAMLENNPISLPVGYHSHINLQATKTERLLADELGRATCQVKELQYFDKYSYQSCQVECLIDMMMDKCNCTGVAGYANIPQDQICAPTQALRCYNKLAYNFSDLLVTCRQERCEEACDYWTYRASLTVSPVFNPLLQEEMLKYWRLPKGEPNRSLIIGDVYFGEIQYTKITQMPALTIETFVSALGGAMGLWTGASVITWIHLLYFCVAKCCMKRSPVRHQVQLLYRHARPKPTILTAGTNWNIEISRST